MLTAMTHRIRQPFLPRIESRAEAFTRRLSGYSVKIEEYVR